MSRRGARLTVAVLFALACGAAGWQYLRVERTLASQSRTAATFERDARTLVASIVDLRAAQQAYVASGQGIDYWTVRVTQDSASVRSRLDALRQQATSSEATARIDAAVNALDDFMRMDGRAREYVVAGQRLLASDLIFGDGFEVTRSIGVEIEGALAAESAAGVDILRRIRAQQRLLAGGVAGLGLFFLLILAFAPGPRPRADAGEPAVTAASLNLTSPLTREAATPPQPREPAYETDRVMAPPVDLTGAAQLCVDLARVSDTQQIPVLLERAARVLDATGIVLWMAEPEGRELVATVAHGYPATTITRLGSIHRNADNATAAAYRESRVHTVSGDTFTSGAIVAPLVTPGGCVGVMAAEVGGGREGRAEVRAVASIVAAQLATLLGIAPVARPHAQAN